MGCLEYAAILEAAPPLPLTPGCRRLIRGVIGGLLLLVIPTGSCSLADAALRPFPCSPPCLSFGRFEKEVLGGRLWHPACQQAAGDITEEIPLQVGLARGWRRWKGGGSFGGIPRGLTGAVYSVQHTRKCFHCPASRPPSPPPNVVLRFAAMRPAN